MTVADEAAGWAEALRRIAACRAARADTLDLGGLQLTRVPEEVAGLINLTSLDLGNNNIDAEGVQALAGLANLRSLNMSSNSLNNGALTDLSALTSLTSLTSLNLFNNFLVAARVKKLEGLINLTDLNLNANCIGPEGAKTLKGLFTLKSLGLDANGIGDAGVRTLSELGKLTSLNLAGNGITAQGAIALRSLINLTNLNLAKNFFGSSTKVDNCIGTNGAHALGALVNLASLNLVGNDIGDDGARALGALGGLTSLELGSNQIGDAGARAVAECLTRLTSLELGSNQIGDAGARAVAERLTSLTNLDLGSNQIGDAGARAIAERLTSLTNLDLGSNQIGDAGARAIAERLTSLTNLDLGSNQIGDAGARAVAERLTSLTNLDLGSNQIGDAGARAIAERLTSLTNLDLGSNQIGDAGARAIAERLTSLTSLELGSNQIGDSGARAIFNAWADRVDQGHLSVLDLSGNDDLSALLPAEILNQRLAAPILAAWRNLREAAGRAGGLLQFNEAKLIVVGDEAGGKSSLIRYLRERLPRTGGHAKTRGINVLRWQPDRRPEHKAWTLNVWDFAGQEMTFGTHQFFLTRRSLYLLVLNDRKEDDRRALVKWLNTVRNRGGDSPVLVVINQSDKEKHDRVASRTGNWGLSVGDSVLRENPQIVGVLRTSCNDDDYSRGTIAALEDSIVSVLRMSERLAEIRRGVPNEWLRVKERVTHQAARDKVLKEARYKQLCEEPATKEEAQNGRDGPPIVDLPTQRAVLGMLDNLGVVVAYGLEEDAPPNREKSLLDPNWLTTAFYTVLNSGLIRDQSGVFSREDLGRLLDEKDYPARDHHFILDMMQDPVVELAVRFTDGASPRYLMPQALPQAEPAIAAVDVFGADVLHFRYRYKYLPPSFVPKFIVKTAAKSYEPPHRWRTGVLLRVDDCPVRVEAIFGPRDAEPQQVEIQIAGPKEKRYGALNGVRHFMDQMHHDNPGIEPIAYVPLPEQSKLHIEVRRLEQARSDPERGMDFRPDIVDAKRRYTVRELLEAGCYERPLPPTPEPAIAILRTTRGLSWVQISSIFGAIISVLLIASNPLRIGEWIDRITTAIAAGALGFLAVLMFNPATIYRRTLKGWLALAAFPFGAGQILELLFKNIPILNQMKFDFTPSPLMVATWAGIAVLLVAADLAHTYMSKRAG